MIDCGKNTQRDHDVQFFRVPVVVKHQGEEVEELSSERRRKWIAAINRQDLTEKTLENDRVCSLHFINGEAAASWDQFNVDWVPTKQLGYSKSGPEEAQKVSQETVNARAARARARRKRLNDQQERGDSEKRKRLNEPGKPVSAIAFSAEDVALCEQESVSLELEASEQSAPCVGSGEENENVGTTTKKESCIASVQTDMKSTTCSTAVMTLPRHLSRPSLKMTMKEFAFTLDYPRSKFSWLLSTTWPHMFCGAQ